MITIRNIKVSNEFGKKVWDYYISIDGQDYTFDSDRSLTLEEIKKIVLEKSNSCQNLANEVCNN
jgi:hypothetical protein